MANTKLLKGIYIALLILQALFAIAVFVLLYQRKDTTILVGLMIATCVCSFVLSITIEKFKIRKVLTLIVLLLATSLYTKAPRTYRQLALIGILLLSLTLMAVSGMNFATPALLGSGLSGIVYSGNVGCINSEEGDAGVGDSLVSKVGPAEEIDHEASVLRRVRDVDPQGLYHMVMVGDVCDTFPPQGKQGTWKRMLLEKGGLTLHDLLTKTTLFRREFELRKNIPHIVDGLLVLEKHGIQYDDLATCNIILGVKDGLWRLIDFGEAKFTTQPTRINLHSSLNKVLTDIARVNTTDVEWARHYIRQNYSKITASESPGLVA